MKTAEENNNIMKNQTLVAFEIGKVDLSKLELGEEYFIIAYKNKECATLCNEDEGYFFENIRSDFQVENITTIYLPTPPLVLDEERIEQMGLSELLNKIKLQRRVILDVIMSDESGSETPMAVERFLGQIINDIKHIKKKSN